MSISATVYFLIAAVLTVASVVFTAKLYKGEWLLFVVGRQVFTDDAKKIDGFRRTGKRMALVTAAFALLMVTIVWYKAAELAGQGTLKTVGLHANNIAFLLFIIALIAFYLLQRIDKNKESKLARVDKKDTSSAAARMARRAQKARVDSFPTASIVFLIVIAVAAFGMGLLFSGM